MLSIVRKTSTWIATLAIGLLVATTASAKTRLPAPKLPGARSTVAHMHRHYVHPVPQKSGIRPVVPPRVQPKVTPAPTQAKPKTPTQPVTQPIPRPPQKSQ